MAALLADNLPVPPPNEALLALGKRLGLRPTDVGQLVTQPRQVRWRRSGCFLWTRDHVVCGDEEDGSLAMSCRAIPCFGMRRFLGHVMPCDSMLWYEAL